MIDLEVAGESEYFVLDFLPALLNVSFDELASSTGTSSSRAEAGQFVGRVSRTVPREVSRPQRCECDLGRMSPGYVDGVDLGARFP